MPRPSGLTLEDLRALYRIVKEKPASHTAAADLVGFNRQRLSRLIQRVNERIGEGDLDWRYTGRFLPPPEARRIARAFEDFEATLTDIEGSPRVSAGTTASLLLAAYLRQTSHVSIKSDGFARLYPVHVGADILHVVAFIEAKQGNSRIQTRCIAIENNQILLGSITIYTQVVSDVTRRRF